MNNLLSLNTAYSTQYPASTYEDVVILPVWIQSRVSTAHQVGTNIRGVFQEKASLDEQVKLCKEVISTYKGNCPKCSKEIRLTYIGESAGKGESGRNIQREDTDEILKMAQEGMFKVMITTENDRIARRRSTAVVIRDKLKMLGIQVYAISQPLPIKCPNCFDPLDDDVGIITETISDMKSQLDLSRIRRNYKIGMPKRIERGKPTGSLAYGLIKKYEVVGKDYSGNDQLQIKYVWDEQKANIVKRIIDDYLSGKGTWLISLNLNLEGIPSSQGKKWSRSAILIVLKNPIYAGLIRYGWKPVKNGKRKIQPRENWMIRNAEFPGIITKDKYESVQKEIHRRKTIGGRASSSGGLLIGLIKCGYCGYSMFQTNTKSTFKNGRKYIYKGYACGTFLQRGSCQHNSKKQDYINGIILKEVLKLANDETRKSFYNKLSKTKISSFKKTLKQKESVLKNLKKTYERVLYAYRSGIDSIEEYAKNKENLLPQIETLELEYLKLKDSKKTLPIFSWNKQYENAINKFLTSPTEEDKIKIKIILSRLIERIEFKKNPLSIKIFYKIDL